MATNANGDGPASPASAVVIPRRCRRRRRKPTAVAGNAQITVTFAAPNDGGSAITGLHRDVHVVERRRGGNRERCGLADRRDRVDEREAYTCTVTATNANGTGAASAPSAAGVPSTAPSAPAQPTVAPGKRADHGDLRGAADGGSAITELRRGLRVVERRRRRGAGSGAASPIVVNGYNGKTYTCTGDGHERER